MQLTIHSRCYRRRNRRHRSGLVLILFLACLAVATALIIGAARMAVTSHQATQTTSWSVQARWLAESGAERAAAKLAADSAYTGETWTIPAADLGGEDGGVVRIQVKPGGNEKHRTIRVEADFPEDPVHFAKQEKEINVTIP